MLDDESGEGVRMGKGAMTSLRWRAWVSACSFGSSVDVPSADNVSGFMCG